MDFSKIRLKRTLLAMAVAGALVAPVVIAQQSPPAPGAPANGSPGNDGPADRDPARRPPPKPVSVAGKVLRYNHSPRGEIDGIIVQSQEKIFQLNTPPGMGSVLPAVAPIGKGVKLLGRTPPPRPARPPSPDGKQPPAVDHDVYDFAGLDDGTPPPEPPAPGAEPTADAKVEGTVASLNYSRRGELNGVVLDSGDFVSIGPREAAELKLAVGQKVTASGDSLPMADGHKAIGAKELNGQSVRRPKPPSERGRRPDGEAGPKPDGERGPRPDGERGPRPDGERGPRPDGDKGPPPLN